MVDSAMSKMQKGKQPMLTAKQKTLPDALKKKKKLDKNIVTHNGKRMTTEEANVQHYQDQVRQAYADYAEKSKKGRDPL
jgi:hypothetical protein